MSPLSLLSFALGAALFGQQAAVPSDSDCLGADWRQQQGEARAKVRSGHLAPLEHVVSEIRRRRPGRLLDACLETDPDGRIIYRVRWAALDGRRVDFRVDAATGAVLKGR
jgi:uncharacterized membrane protein YkoI